MKTYILIFSFLFCATTSNAADPWSIGDKTLAATMSTLLIVDWGQTINISRDPTYCEVNPLLGSHPEEKDVHLYMGSALIGTLAISHLLPSKYRSLFMFSIIAIELPTVYNNHKIGLRMPF